jgi:hypothetical protein
MATKKSDKKKPEGNTEALKEAREREAGKDVFTYLGKVKEGSKKLAPQAQCIVNIIEAAGKKGLTRKELGQEMKGVVLTKQPVGRILSYYQKMLVDRGYVEIEKAAIEA